ncbi:MAG: energy transducer TonB [Acidobacteria bacterium]|nr:energy transducer TonB [Acidobacteriota bacterium]
MAGTQGRLVPPPLLLSLTLAWSALAVQGQTGGPPQTQSASEDLLSRIRVSYEKPLQTTWYTPMLDDKVAQDVTVYPYIGKKDAGGRWLRLHASVRDGDWIFVEAVRFLVDGDEAILKVSRADVDAEAEGYGISETVDVGDVEPLIRQIAQGREVYVSFVGRHRRKHHEMGSADLNSFKRIISLYDSAGLPEGREVIAKAESRKEEEFQQKLKAGPVFAGVDGVSLPIIEESTRVQPKYPELARQARIEGKVISQVVIKKDGSIGDIQILSAPGEKMGFEEAFMEAVRKWKYKPALYEGQPVDVWFIVIVDFTLR